DGLITITGGKLTEYRLMAEQAVDLVVERTGLAAGSCHTADLPLIGAPGHPETSTSPAGYLPAALVERFGLESAAVVAASALDRPLEPVAEGLDVTRAEFSHAATPDGAPSADDAHDRPRRARGDRRGAGARLGQGLGRPELGLEALERERAQRAGALEAQFADRVGDPGHVAVPAPGRRRQADPRPTQRADPAAGDPRGGPDQHRRTLEDLDTVHGDPVATRDRDAHAGVQAEVHAARAARADRPQSRVVERTPGRADHVALPLGKAPQLVAGREREVL